MKNTVRFFIIPIFVIVLIYFSYRVFVMIALSNIFNDSVYTKKDLIENYIVRQDEISELIGYFESILPEGKHVSIEFEEQEIAIFHLTNKNGKRDSNWNLKMNSEKADSLISQLGWGQENLLLLKKKLDLANCISIESGNPITLGFQRSGMGKFYYKIFNENLPDSLIASYNDGCQYSFYMDNVVLEYGGGAIGPNCFEDFTR